MNTYVHFSDHALTVPKETLTLSGCTDEKTSLKDLLIIMYKEWSKHLQIKDFTESRIVDSSGRPTVLG